MLAEALAIAAGGSLGASLRALLLRAVAARGAGEAIAGLRFGTALATWLANSLGCLILGLWLGGLLPRPQGLTVLPVEAFVVTGLCGGLTTFSTLCGDAVTLARERGGRAVTTYLLVTLIVGGVALELWLGTLS